jgi:hypothetical protein
MLDRFLGSDVTNDDVVNTSYFARDYDATVVGEETLDGFRVHHLSLVPRPEAPVTYGKVELWLRVEDCAPVLMRTYDDNSVPLTTTRYGEFRDFGGHQVPTVWAVQNERENDRRTTFRVLDAAFDGATRDSVFTRENLERYP